MAPGLLVDKDKGSADLLSTKILYGIQSLVVLDSQEGDRTGRWGIEKLSGPALFRPGSGLITNIYAKCHPKAGLVW